MPEVREVAAEDAEALGRELEVVRLRKGQQQCRPGSRTARTGTARPARWPASHPRAKTRSAASTGAPVGDPVPCVGERTLLGQRAALAACPRRPGRAPGRGSAGASRRAAARRRCSEARRPLPRARARAGSAAAGRSRRSLAGGARRGAAGPAGPARSSAAQADTSSARARIVATSAVKRLAVAREALLEHRGVAERPDRLDERVGDRAGPVPVEREPQLRGCWYKATGGTLAAGSRSRSEATRGPVSRPSGRERSWGRSVYDGHHVTELPRRHRGSTALSYERAPGADGSRTSHHSR